MKNSWITNVARRSAGAGDLVEGKLMDKYALGRNIFDRLRVIKMSQRVLAEKLDIHEGTVSKWINGMSEPKASMLYRISRILGVTMDELMEGTFDE